MDFKDALRKEQETKDRVNYFTPAFGVENKTSITYLFRIGNEPIQLAGYANSWKCKILLIKDDRSPQFNLEGQELDFRFGGTLLKALSMTLQYKDRLLNDWLITYTLHPKKRTNGRIEATIAYHPLIQEDEQATFPAPGTIIPVQVIPTAQEAEIVAKIENVPCPEIKIESSKPVPEVIKSNDNKLEIEVNYKITYQEFLKHHIFAFQDQVENKLKKDGKMDRNQLHSFLHSYWRKWAISGLEDQFKAVIVSKLYIKYFSEYDLEGDEVVEWYNRNAKIMEMLYMQEYACRAESEKVQAEDVFIN